MRTSGRGRTLHPEIDGSYLQLDRGQGVFVWDSDGRQYLDAVAGVGVLALGYGRDDLVSALAGQSSRLPYAHSMRFRNRPQEELSDLLAPLMPGQMSWSFFCSGGSEALDSAVKLVRQYWIDRGQPSKYKIVGRKPSFHGNTLAALSVGFHPVRRRPFAPYLIDMPHIRAPWTFHCGHPPASVATCDDCSGRSLRNLLEREGRDSVAAFIAEPIIGAAAPGVTPPSGYYEEIRRICDEYEILWIDDEVMTGMGRTGEYWGVQHWDALPDIVITAKGLGSGYAPIAAVIASDHVVETMRGVSGRFEHNFTMAGNPPACAVACEVIRVFEREEIVDHARSAGRTLHTHLGELRSHPIVGDVRGKGLMAGIEFNWPNSTEPLPPEWKVAARVDAAAKEEGLLVYPCSGILDGSKGDALLLLPPLVIDDRELEDLVSRLDRALARVQVELPL